MRILQIIPSVGPLRGGPSVSVPALCKGLADAGLQVTLITTDDNGRERLKVPLGQPLETEGYTRWYFARQTFPYSVSMPTLAWLKENARRFDLAHVHGVFAHVSDWSPRVLRQQRVRYGITPRGMLGNWGMTQRHARAKQAVFRLLVDKNLTGAAFVHVTSELERADLPMGQWHTKCQIIPNGLPLSVRPNSRDFAGGPLQILFLSRIDPKKGLELLLHSIAGIDLRAYPVELTIAGDGPAQYIHFLRELVTKLGLGANVRWLGFVSGEQKQAAFSGADLFVLPSHDENFGNAPVEAMAAGLPIIITDRVGIAPDVIQASAGKVVTYEAESLKTAILDLHGAFSVRMKMGLNGQRLVQHRFTLEAMTTNMIELYQKALQPSRNF